jgi:hypothetical protein
VSLLLTAREASRLVTPVKETKVVAAKAKGDAPRTIATKAELAAGGGFPCTATPPCTRKLRTQARASEHAADRNAVQQKGHLAI